MFSKTDRCFLTRATLGNPFELDASQMISDLTIKVALARVGSGMTLPVGVSKTQQRLLGKLKTAGKNFDQVYKAEMLFSHAQAAKLFSTHSGSRRANATLRAVATGGLPTIKVHLNAAGALRRCKDFSTGPDVTADR